MIKYALITGAAKGIGRAIAEELAKKKYNVLLADVDGESLNASAVFIKNTYSVSAHVLHIDLSEQDAASQLFQWSRPYHEWLSVVVNNAGYGINAPFGKVPLSHHLDLINVNIGALMSITYFFIPVLSARPKSWLLNVGSTTAYQTIPYLNTYASSKAFVLSFTRGVRHELRRSSVSVSCLSPGSTDTDFVNRAGMSARTKKLARRYNMTPESVAQIAVRDLFRGKSEIVPGFLNKLHAALPKFFPKSFVERIGAKIYGPDIKQDHSFTPFLSDEEQFHTTLTIK